MLEVYLFLSSVYLFFFSYFVYLFVSQFGILKVCKTILYRLDFLKSVFQILDLA
jgi:hypothetical protein